MTLLRLLRVLRILRVVRIFRMFRELTIIAQAFFGLYRREQFEGFRCIPNAAAHTRTQRHKAHPHSHRRHTHAHTHTDTHAHTTAQKANPHHTENIAPKHGLRRRSAP